jgi:hypothetical protein
LLERKLRKHQGDVHASSREATTDAARQSLAGLDRPRRCPARAEGLQGRGGRLQKGPGA